MGHATFGLGWKGATESFLCAKKHESIIECALKKKKILLRHDTRLMVPSLNGPICQFQLSAEETHCVYWKHSLLTSGKRVVLPVLFCLQSQSWPFGWLLGVSAKILSSVSFCLGVLCVLTHYEEGKELLLCNTRQKPSLFR